MLQLINKLKEANIDVLVKGNDLELHFDHTEISEELIKELKENKQALIQFLKKYSTTSENNEIKAVAEAENYELSDAQKRLWIVSQTEEASTAYNMPSYKHVDRIDDFESFEKALKAVVERHEILRTVFKKDANDDIKQWILPASEVNCSIEQKDFSTEENAEALAFAYAKEDSFKPFNLENGPLFRVSLLKVADNHTILYYNMHHIISDGWSMDILAKDLMAYYQAFKANETPNLPALKIQYKDYAAWQLEQLQNESLQDDKAFWVQKLAGDLSVLDLPSNLQRPLIKTFNGRSSSTYINSAVVEKLRKYTQQEKGSVFIGLLATLNILLQKYTGQKDIILGTAIAGRDHADLEDQIGFYINTLALRNQVDDTLSFNEFFNAVKETTLTAYKHQTYPFDRLVNDLNVMRDSSRNVVFDMMITQQNIGERSQKAVADKVDTDAIVDLGECMAKLDISITFEEIGDAVSMVIIYNSDVYESSVIAKFMRSFKTLLSTIVENTGQAISELKYLSGTEETQLLHTFNDTKVVYDSPETFVEMFQQQVAKTPEHIALAYKGKEITYKELDVTSNQLANCLKNNLSINKGDIVGVQMDHGEWLLNSVLAILKVGATYVPISPELPEASKAHIVEDTAMKLLLSSAYYAFELDYFEGDKFIVDLEFTATDFDENFATTEITKDDIAYTIYTSGSTGKPKGVLIANESFTNYLNWAKSCYKTNDLQNFDFGFFTSISFDLTITSMFLPLVSGSTLHIFSKRSNVLETLTTYFTSNISCIKLTPAHISLLKGSDFSDTKVEMAIVGGEALQKHHIEILRSINPAMRIYNEYGPTEATVGCVVSEIKEVDDKILIGKPIANTEIYILDAHQNLVTQGVQGEMYIGGKGLAKGYLKRPELTAEKFVQNPFNKNEILYKTGDIAKWDDHGNIDYIGRVDNQVKIKGYRIELGEIEAKILTKTGIKQVVVSVLDYNDEKVIAAYFVATSQKNTVDKAALREALSKELPFYMLPNYYIEMDRIPLTSNGKIDTSALPSISEKDIIKETFVAPSTPEEEILASVWKDVLGRDKISIKDNFYNLGGDSIKSIQIGSRLNQLGYRLGVEHMLKNPVLEDLAKYLEVNLKVVDQSLVSGEVALTPIQHFFFNEPSIPVAHHFNQTVLLKSEEAIDTEILSKCIETLVAHHDALRMVCKKENGQWIQTNKKMSKDAFEVQFYDLTKNEEPLQEMQRIGSEIQSTINLENGPLCRVAHFRLQDGDRFAIIIHHLVVDGVSWRIILEDFTTVFEAFTQQKEPALPLKTDSFQLWSSKLQVYAASETMQKERTYWEAVCSQEVTPIPVNTENDTNVFNYNKTVSFEIDANITELLLSKVHHIYNTEINDILLTSLGLAIKNTFGLEKAVVKMEGHGRENIIDNVDINRTVGWFTSVYPFVVDVSECSDDKEALVQVKEGLRKIPNKGVGYGILQYLTSNFTANIQPSIVFNYLGDFGATQENFENKKLQQAFESIGASIAKENGNDVPLNIYGMIAAGQLQISLDYQKETLTDEKVAELMENYKTNLSKLIYELSKEERTYLTPSDVTYKKLSNKVLAELNSENTIEDIYELSPLQQGMYYHWKADTSNSQYIEQLTYRLKTNTLPVKAVAEAYEKLVARHTILRTSFTEKYSDTILQIVHKKVEGTFVYNKFESKATSETIDDYVQQIKIVDREKGFDLTNLSQMRLTLIQLTDNTYEFIWSFHHILMDGWCVSMLINEFYQLLNGIINKVPVSLPKPLPYSDYIKWLNSVDKEKSLSYWDTYVTGYTDIAKVPFELQEKESNVFNKTAETVRLQNDTFQKVKQLCSSLEITQNTFIQGIWGYLLSRYNNTKDVIFGTIVSGRPTDLMGVENMIGLFINTIPVRVSYTENDTPTTLLKKLHQASAEANSHHYVGLSEILSRQTSVENFINHIVVFENYPLQDTIKEELESTRSTAIELEIEAMDVSEQSNYDFEVIVVPEKEALSINFEFNTNKYNAALIQNLTIHFAKIVDAFCENTSQSLENINYITDAEVATVLNVFNNTKTAYPSEATIDELFSKQVAETPSAVAVSYQDKQLTYAALEARSNQFANYLQTQHNVAKGDIVAILLERSENLPVVTLGILKTGAAYLPLDPSYPQERIELVQKDSNFKVAVTDTVLNAFLSEETLSEEKQFVVDSSSEDLAYIMYTSGSTGQPKAVMIPQKSVVRLVKSANYYDFSSADKLISTGAFSFDATTFEYWGMLLNGGELILCDQDVLLQNSALQNEIRTRKANVMWFTAGWSNQLIDDNIQVFEGLETVLLGGEKLSPKHIQKLRNQYPNLQIINGYGPTENTTFSLTYDIKEATDLIPIGKPISNSTAYILNEKLQLQPVGVVGEIYLGGDGLAKGYLNDLEKTAEKFIDNPYKKGEKIYKSGDLGMWLTDGNILYMGRNDNQVKIRGHRIELGEIEQVLQTQDTIAQVAVTVKTIEKDQTIVAYILPENGSVDKEALKNNLKQVLPEYMIPNHYVEVSEMPLNSNGKVDYKALPELQEADIIRTEYEEATTETQKQLVAIWKNLLQLEKVGVRDNFFDIGGHSIKAIKMSHDISTVFDLDVSIKNIFVYPTIEQLAAQIDIAKKQQAAITSNKELNEIEI